MGDTDLAAQPTPRQLELATRRSRQPDDEILRARAGDYPFTAPSVSPPMRKRLRSRNSAITGIDTSSEPAA